MSDPVLEILQKHGHTYKVSGRDYLIKCLNPEHSDSNPSFRIDKVTGAAHCFACGYKTNIFRYYGVFTNSVPIRVAKLKDKLAQVSISMHGVPLPDGATPYLRPFRGISVKTLKQFEAFYTHKLEKLSDRIIFPIKDITGKTRVYVGRHVLSNADPKYINYPASVEMPVFPPRLEGTSASLVLVEGIFDFLNLYDKGMRNVVCTFGTNTLHKDTKQKMLPFKAQGITHIFLMFDGDTAGNKAADILKPILEDLEFIVEIIKLPEDTDPGSMDSEEVRGLIEYTAK